MLKITEASQEDLVSTNQKALLKTEEVELDLVVSGLNTVNSQTVSNRLVMIQQVPDKIIYEFEDKEQEN